MTDNQPQLTLDDLAGMSPHEINTARREGRLNDLMHGTPDTGDDSTEDTDDDGPAELERHVPAPNRAQGVNGGREPERPIYNRGQLAHMSPREINKARRAGKLDHLMGRPARRDR